MTERPSGSVPIIWQSAGRPGFHKSFELELDDHLDIMHRSRQLLPFWPSVGTIGLIALFVALITNFDRWASGNVVIFAINCLAVVVTCALATVVLLKPVRRFWRGRYRARLVKSGQIGRPVDSTVDEKGVGWTSLGQTVTCTWNSLYAMEEEAGTFYFWVSTTVAHPWPARLFASEEERQAFRDSVLEWAGRPFSPPVLARLGTIGRAKLPV